MKIHWLKILSGPVILLLCLLLGGFDSIQARMIGCMGWLLSWWITTAVPIGVTALLPIVLFPLLGIQDLKETTANYANPVIYLFLGGFVLGLAIEKWGLHRRIALNIMKVSGSRPSRIVLGSMLATALLSMWISNTATAVMMLPIGISVVRLLGDSLGDGKVGRNFALTLMLGIAYAANIGGMATIIGTPPNLVLASMVQEGGFSEISFTSWAGFAFPLSVVLFIITFLILKWVFPIRVKSIGGIKEMLTSELQKLGEMNSGEKRTLVVMVATALLWIFRGQLNNLQGLSQLSDPMIAIASAIVFFALPSGTNAKPLLVWKDTQKLPWDILLLFGGGISLAKGMEKTQVVEWFGGVISGHGVQSVLVVILVITALAVFLTEVMSNVALVSVFIPVSFVLAQKLGLEAMHLAVPLTLGASCAFMFPISTPPNAIVFSSGYIKMNQMAHVGIVLNIICILVIAVYSYLVQPFFL